MTTINLTREEAAYAHLAGFQRGERVVIGGRGRVFCDEAVILHPQRFPEKSYVTEADAYLVAVISGIVSNGGHVTISVATLLSGRFHIEHDGEHQWNGAQTWFDAAGYTANPEG